LLGFAYAQDNNSLVWWGCFRLDRFDGWMVRV